MRKRARLILITTVAALALATAIPPASAAITEVRRECVTLDPTESPWLAGACEAGRASSAADRARAYARIAVARGVMDQRTADRLATAARDHAIAAAIALSSGNDPSPDAVAAARTAVTLCPGVTGVTGMTEEPPCRAAERALEAARAAAADSVPSREVLSEAERAEVAAVNAARRAGWL